MQYQDSDHVCIDCQMGFVWTGGEKKFMERLREEGKLDHTDRMTGMFVQGKVTAPKRCPDCRERRKSKKNGNH